MRVSKPQPLGSDSTYEGLKLDRTATHPEFASRSDSTYDGLKLALLSYYYLPTSYGEPLIGSPYGFLRCFSGDYTNRSDSIYEGLKLGSSGVGFSSRLLRSHSTHEGLKLVTLSIRATSRAVLTVPMRT